MAERTIKGNLSVSGIQKMIDEVNAYKQSLLNKNDEFVRRLAELGIPIINERIAEAKGDSDKEHNTYIRLNSYQDYSQATLIVDGKDIAFIEFGAGVHYNGAAGSSPNPKGAELGYTIGSYGKGYGANDYWYYVADTGESVRSYGTQATMPVYSTSVAMRQEMMRIAKEVFGS